MVTLQWDAPIRSAVNNYSITVSPLPPSGTPPPTTDTQTTFTLLYNVDYAIGLTAANCIGSGETVMITFTLGKPFRFGSSNHLLLIVAHSELLSSICCQWSCH